MIAEPVMSAGFEHRASELAAWLLAIEGQLDSAAGDASGSFWSSCLNRLSASSFELLQIPEGN